MMAFSVFVDVFGWVGNDYGIFIEVETGRLVKIMLGIVNLPVIVDKTIDEFQRNSIMY
ncbi:MAG: hypothetical protein LKI76_08120 [Megasphaera sp.]|jgi:hypothetical protein|uniref:hypothetical protein n=1 Tax=Megasphaera sueciensis TaxID=349094 RepID=UPI003D04535C|nr:hypothetical protein [Megasphaera sp.]MCI1823878.1 hypothetical protein [Megasphaera sp.]